LELELPMPHGIDAGRAAIVPGMSIGHRNHRAAAFEWKLSPNQKGTNLTTFKKDPAMPRKTHSFRILTFAAALALAPFAFVAAAPASAQSGASQTAPAQTAPGQGVIRLKSANSFDDTVARLKADVQAKGIRFFDAIDQSALGAQAQLKLGRSTLVLFGNPPLGVQFLQSNPYAGLDWPVRMLVVEDSNGSVWVAWSDFGFMRQRYAITDKDAQFKMAGEVAGSIAAAATAR
jgi:uncharacterized protein (DUF302 family)